MHTMWLSPKNEELILLVVFQNLKLVIRVFSSLRKKPKAGKKINREEKRYERKREVNRQLWTDRKTVTYLNVNGVKNGAEDIFALAPDGSGIDEAGVGVDDRPAFHLHRLFACRDRERERQRKREKADEMRKEMRWDEKADKIDRPESGSTTAPPITFIVCLPTETGKTNERKLMT